MVEVPRIGRNASQFALRMPDGLRDRVKVLAAQNRRSMNAELVLMVERAVAAVESGRNSDGAAHAQQ